MKRSIAALFAALSVVGTVQAQNFPSKPVTVIVGVAPGGALDALARLTAAGMTNQLKQPVVVENVTGAGGLVGFQRLMKSDPDGHTLMFSNMSMVLISLLYPKSGINASADAAAVGQVATVPMVLGVSNKSGIADLSAMLKRMRSEKLNLGSGGPGTTAHMAEGVFLQISKGKGELVQYRGSGPAITDLMAGVIDAVIDQTVTLMPLHQDKRIKAIAVSAPARLPQMPDVPTFAEAGMPEFDFRIWNGYFAPKDTPKPVIAIIADAISKTIDSPEYKAQMDRMASQAPAPAERGPEPLAQLVRSDSKRLEAVAQSAGLHAR